MNIWGLTPPKKWNQPLFEHSYAKLQSGTETMAKHLVFFSEWHLVHIVCTITLFISTMWNSVLLHRTQKHYSFSAGLPAMQVCLYVYHLQGTLCTPCTSYFSELYAEGSL